MYCTTCTRRHVLQCLVFGHHVGQTAPVTATAGARTVDRTIAFFAGRSAWAHAESPRSAVIRMAAMVEIVGFATATATVMQYRYTLEHLYESQFIRLAPLGFAIVAVLLSISPARLAFGWPTPTRTRQFFVPPRAAMGVALIVTTYAVIPGWPSMISWPVGIALGADTALTSWALGWQLIPRRWWGLFVISPIHFGVLGGLIGAAVIQGWDSAWNSAVPIYVTMHLWLLVASTTVWLLSKLHDQEKSDQCRAVTEASSFEHRRSAHWLHDDLCAQLRLVSIKVQSGGATMAEVEAMLDDLDHQMRLRQLEEILESGTIRIAEVLQPYLRRAQNHGVHIDSAPSFDDVSLIVSAEIGREFSHAAAVLTSNALNAGATNISFEVRLSPGYVTLVVIDDAGGIDITDLPIGRGLWTLREDLGRDNVTITNTPTGSRVQAAIALSDRSRHDATVAG